MAKLSDRVQNALDEVRTLVLGVQVLIGFAYTATLERKFETLPASSQRGLCVALVALVMTFALLLAPTAHHRLVEQGRDSPRILAVANAYARASLLPFSLVIAFAVFFAFRIAFGDRAAWIAGASVWATASFCWFGIEALRRSEHAHDVDQEEQMRNDDDGGPTDLATKVKHVLTEARMVLPGAQALLGFQFTAVLLAGFDELPETSKLLHVASLLATTLATILLMAPAAYHRLVERGENTEHFHTVAGRMVLASMVPLAAGLVADLYLVVLKVSDSPLVAGVASGVTATVFVVLWAIRPLVARARRDANGATPREAT